MAERTHKSKPAARTEETIDTDAAAPASAETGEKLKAELDDLLDEIDDVLEVLPGRGRPRLQLSRTAAPPRCRARARVR
jgi:ubiquitin-like protein Pup